MRSAGIRMRKNGIGANSMITKQCCLVFFWVRWSPNPTHQWCVSWTLFFTQSCWCVEWCSYILPSNKKHESLDLAVLDAVDSRIFAGVCWLVHLHKIDPHPPIFQVQNVKFPNNPARKLKGWNLNITQLKRKVISQLFATPAVNSFFFPGHRCWLWWRIWVISSIFATLPLQFTAWPSSVSLGRNLPESSTLNDKDEGWTLSPSIFTLPRASRTSKKVGPV